MLETPVSKSHHRTPSSAVHLPHHVIVKAPGLLPMWYTIAELAEELGMSDRTLREWLATGAPANRNERSRVWVNGEEFAKWVEAQRKSKTTQKLGDDEARCMRCRKPVKMVDPQIIQMKGKLIMIRGTCPECGCVINRGGRRG